MNSLEILAKAVSLKAAKDELTLTETISKAVLLPKPNCLGLRYDDHSYCLPRGSSATDGDDVNKTVKRSTPSVSDHSYSEQNSNVSLDNFSSCLVSSLNDVPVLIAGRRIACGDILMFCKKFGNYWKEFFGLQSNLLQTEPQKIKLPKGFLLNDDEHATNVEQDVQLAARSTSPNAVIYAHLVDNSLQMYLIAKRKIKNHEPITVAMYKEKSMELTKPQVSIEIDDESTISSSADSTPKKSTPKSRKRKLTSSSDQRADKVQSVSPDSTTKVYGNINWNLNRIDSEQEFKPEVKECNLESGSPKTKKRRTSIKEKTVGTSSKPSAKLSREEKKMQHYMKMIEKMERKEKRKEVTVKVEDENVVSSTTEVNECNIETQFSANSSSEDDKLFHGNETSVVVSSVSEIVNSNDGVKLEDDNEATLNIEFKDLHFKKRRSKDFSISSTDNDEKPVKTPIDSQKDLKMAEYEIEHGTNEIKMEAEIAVNQVTSNEMDNWVGSEISSASETVVKTEPKLELKTQESSEESDSDSDSSSSSSSDSSEESDVETNPTTKLEKSGSSPEIKSLTDSKTKEPQLQTSKENRKAGVKGKGRMTNRRRGNACKGANLRNMKVKSSGKSSSDLVLAKYHHRYAAAPKSKYLTRGNLVKETKEVEETIIPQLNEVKEIDPKIEEKPVTGALKCIKMKKMFLNEWINEQAQEKVETAAAHVANDENANNLRKTKSCGDDQLITKHEEIVINDTPVKTSIKDSYITSAKKRWLQKAIKSTEKTESIAIDQPSKPANHIKVRAHKISESYEVTENNNISDSFDNVFFEPPVSMKKKMSLSEYKKRRHNDSEEFDRVEDFRDIRTPTRTPFIETKTPEAKEQKDSNDKVLLMPLEAIKNKNNVKPGHREPQSLQERKKIIHENLKRELEKLKFRNTGVDGIENLRRELAEEQESVGKSGSCSDLERSPIIAGVMRAYKASTPKHYSSNIENHHIAELNQLVESFTENSNADQVDLETLNVEVSEKESKFDELDSLIPDENLEGSLNESAFVDATQIASLTVKKKRKKRHRVESPPPPPPPPMPAPPMNSNPIPNDGTPRTGLPDANSIVTRFHPAHQQLTQQVLVTPAGHPGQLPCSGAVLLPNGSCAVTPAGQFAMQQQPTTSNAMLQQQSLLPIPVIIHSGTLPAQPTFIFQQIHENKP